LRVLKIDLNLIATGLTTPESTVTLTLKGQGQGQRMGRTETGDNNI